MSLHFYGSKPIDNDYWKMNAEGWQEYQLLIHHPKEYFTNLFVSPYEHESGFFGSIQSYWNDLKNNIILKIISIFNIYSRGDYYINSLFLNFFGFLGHIALFRVFSDIYKNLKNSKFFRLKLIAGCFLLPSCLYFSSGLHKDAVVFTALGLLCFAVYNIISRKQWTGKAFVILILSAILLVLVRSYVFVLIVPALAAYFLAEKRQWPAIATFAGVYLLFLILFFSISKVMPAVDPPATVVQKQQDFSIGSRMSTAGITRTALPLEKLTPDFVSFAKNAGSALNHSLMRPYITEQQSKLLIPLALELLTYEILFLISLYFVIKNRVFRFHPFVTFGIFLTITVCLNIGYIVDNIGSIVRYRSLYLPFLMVPIFMQMTSFEKKLLK